MILGQNLEQSQDKLQKLVILLVKLSKIKRNENSNL